MSGKMDKYMNQGEPLPVVQPQGDKCSHPIKRFKHTTHVAICWDWILRVGVVGFGGVEFKALWLLRLKAQEP